MKSIMKLISLVPLYFIIVVFNNLQNLVIDKSFINVDFVNFPTILTFIIVGSLIVFFNKLNKNKKVLISCSIVSIGCLLLNGYLGDKHIYKYILLFLMLMYNSYAFSKITKQNFEISIFASNAIVLLIALVLGFFNLLNILIYVIIALEIISLLYIITNNKKMKKAYELGFNNISVLIFSIMFLTFVLGGINRFVHTWDEYSHWAYDATVLNEYDKLSTCEEVVSSTRNYPPALSLWHYFTSRIADFNEQHLYISLSLFILISIMPAFSFSNKNNKAFLPLMTIILFFGASLFGGIYTYTTLYADLAIASVFFSSFVTYFLYRDKNETAKNYILFLNLAIMVLVKPTGIINAFVFFVIIALIDYLKWNDNKFNKANLIKNIVSLWKKYWKLGISVVAVFVIWFGYVKICNMTIPMYYNVKVLPESLETGISYKLNKSVIANVLLGVVESFDDKLIKDYTFLQFVIIIIVVALCALYIANNHNFKKAFYLLLPFIIGGAIYFVLTALAIFATFSVYEASKLASFGRYMNSFNVAVFLLLVIYLCSSNFLKNKGAKLFSFLILVFIFGEIGALNITYSATDMKSRMKTRDVSYELRDKFEVLNNNTPEDCQVYVLDQTDKTGIMAMWYARYYGFPRRTNAYHQSIAWKIRTESNGWDLQDWGLTAEQLSTDLINSNFDYLYLYSSTEEMFEKMKFMFEDYETCRNYTLFKVKEYDGRALLIGVE